MQLFWENYQMWKKLHINLVFNVAKTPLNTITVLGILTIIMNTIKLLPKNGHHRVHIFSNWKWGNTGVKQPIKWDEIDIQKQKFFDDQNYYCLNSLVSYIPCFLYTWVVVESNEVYGRLPSPYENTNELMLLRMLGWVIAVKDRGVAIFSTLRSTISSTSVTAIITEASIQCEPIMGALVTDLEKTPKLTAVLLVGVQIKRKFVHLCLSHIERE